MSIIPSNASAPDFRSRESHPRMGPLTLATQLPFLPYVLSVGGYWGNGSNGGLSYANVNNDSDNYNDNIGSRLTSILVNSQLTVDGAPPAGEISEQTIAGLVPPRERPAENKRPL